MRRYITYLMISLIAFVVGLASAYLWQSKRALLKPLLAENVSEIDRKIIDPRWVYIHRDIKWRARPLPPPEITSYWKENNPDWDVSQWKESEARDRVVIFYPSGDYAEILVALWRRDDTPAIDFAPNGESSYHTYQGKWSLNADGTISTIANYSRMGAFNIRSRSLPDVSKRKWFIRRLAVGQLVTLIETDGEAFVPASEIKDLRHLVYMVNGGHKVLNDHDGESNTQKGN